MTHKTPTIKERMLKRLIPLMVAVILLMTFSAYFIMRNVLVNDYKTQRNYITDNAIHALGLIDAGFSMLDLHLEQEMAEAILTYKRYYEGGIELESIKNLMNHQYDLIVIDETNTITHSTMPEAMGFNFSDFDTEVGERITAIRLGDSVVHDKIRTNVGNGTLSKFTYLPAKDNSVLLEIIYSAPGTDLDTQNLDPMTSMMNLAEATPYVKEIAIYDVYGFQFSHGSELFKPTNESLEAVSLAKKHGTYEKVSQSITTRFLYIPDDGASPLSNHSKILSITFSSEPLNNLLRTLSLIIFFGGVLVLVATTALVYNVVQKITSPISALTNAAITVAMGNYHIAVPEGAPDEIGKLSRIFNGMIQRVNQNYIDIESKFKTTLLSMGDGVIAVDSENNIELMNGVAEALTGFRLSEVHGMPIDKVFFLTGEMALTDTDSGKDYLKSNIGDILPIEYSISNIVNEEGHFKGKVLVFRDVSDKNEKLKRIEYLSYHDQLTGLYNRHYFEQHFSKMDALPLSLLILDVNGLKLINDAFGHQAGDELLKITAHVLKQICRENDVICRIGGDEFVVLMPSTSLLQAETLTHDIQKAIERIQLNHIVLSVSIGFATKVNEQVSIEAVFKVAEDYMYRKKLSESLEMRRAMIDRVIKTLHDSSEAERIHSEKVAEFCEAFGRYLKFSEMELATLTRAAYMHDIGKIAINLSLFDPTRNLSKSEKLEVERHPEVGYQILKSVNEYTVVSEIVLAHHERWDGSGYPRSIKGHAIPIEAQIISLGNLYDRLKRQLGADEATLMEAASKEANAGFSPDLIDHFVAWLKQSQ